MTLPPPSEFYQQIRHDYDRFLDRAAIHFPPHQTLRIDLHCHDHNSDTPDELWGRILHLPESWLKTKTLIKRLHAQQCKVITVTNHNNARSCWALLDKGIDVLVGAEFTCHFPDESLSVHVLIYGFTPEQEVRLNQLRQNIYHFAAYANEHHLPTILPHPLYFYTYRQRPTLPLLEKFACLFERFEVLNGQRGYWQNALTHAWVESLTEERIEEYGRRHGLNPTDFCRHPFRKQMSGGSDDHNGIFAGHCGTQIHLAHPYDQQNPPSAWALHGLRYGEIAPFGTVGEEERLSVTFLDYFAQVAHHLNDPGLLRLMLHHGSLEDKFACLLLGNSLHELQRHPYTMQFLEAFHQSLHGKKPGTLFKLTVNRDFRPLLKQLEQIAQAQLQPPQHFSAQLRQSLPALYDQIMAIIVRRLDQRGGLDFSQLLQLSAEEMVEGFELPSFFRSWSQPRKKWLQSTTTMTPFHPAALFDALSFPILAMGLVVGALFAGTRVLYANRPFLNQLADQIGHHRPPPRTLWLTDTLNDANGVAYSMQNLLAQIQHHHDPIDLLVCHPTLEPAEHLIVLRPLTSFRAATLSNQVLYLPNLLELQQIFEKQSYDRIVCSTELLMGPIAIYLAKAFSVPVWFYMHTDWLDYLKQATPLSRDLRDRFRRLLRLFYQQFDGIWVLNSDHRRWLSSSQMAVAPERIRLTRHWLNPLFRQQVDRLPPRLPTRPHDPVLIYAGRLSEEKGVMKLPKLFNRLKRHFPTLKLLIAGTGVAESALRELLPEATFLGWLDQESLIHAYRQADLMIMPSRFDTFGNVVLEAMYCGVPVAAYNLKGPKEIIEDGVSGLLAETTAEMGQRILQLLRYPNRLAALSAAAVERATTYQAEPIMAELLSDLGVSR